VRLLRRCPEKNKHAASCKKGPKALVKRIWRVKYLKAEGKTNAEINPFAKIRK
jgi:hypothetical protein